MWNETDDSIVEGSNIATVDPFAGELDESSKYNIFFTTYNPHSPAYSNNITDLGISINLLKFCLEGVGITTVSVLGVIGNILSIIVLSSSRMRSSSSVFLLCLSFCDITVLVGATLLIGIPSLLAYNPEDGRALVFNIMRILQFGYCIPGFYAFTVTAITGSILFTLALTLDRYLAVCKPFFARNLCTWSRAVVVSSVIMVVNILYNLPKWWEYTYVVEETNNFTIYRPVPAAIRTNVIYDTYYTHFSYLVLMFVTPICSLIVLNVLIYLKIREANKLRKNLSPTQKNENSLTKMLFGVVAVFLMCQLFPAILNMTRYLSGDREMTPEVEFVVVFLFVVNSSVNFLIYCAIGGKFREIFCDMFCCWNSNSRIRRLAASTKTTLRSLSLSSSTTTGRSRAFSIQSQGAIQHANAMLAISPPANQQHPQISMISHHILQP
ncbi:FMRFamide receptor [Orchesella cincta]|uniref:FMRFamide receptor n=1 Tax=Orchesella cincta TaxID=48709 RepID=A0A1D2MZ42_ORCCI|nr:FMRFamide receptor [Orchesella cincta]